MNMINMVKIFLTQIKIVHGDSYMQKAILIPVLFFIS